MNRPIVRTGARRASDRRPASPRRADSCAISSRASSSPSAEVLRQTPPQRIGRVGARAEPDGHVDDLLDARNREILVAEQPRPRRIVADHEHVGLAAMKQARATLRHRPGGASIPGPRSRPSDRRPRPGSAVSAAPAAKSATTASIGMPRPAIMMPVWPVARKSASSAARLQRPGDRQRGVFLAQRAVGADGQQPLAAALQARCRSGCSAGGRRMSISRRPQPLGRFLQVPARRRAAHASR